MSTLHTVNNSPFERSSLTSCLDHLNAGDAVLLIEDGVVGARKSTRFAAELEKRMGECKVYQFTMDPGTGFGKGKGEYVHMMHVTPPQTAPDFIRVSPLADAAGWADVDQATLRHKSFENVWSLGDVMNAPLPRPPPPRASRRRWWPRTSSPTSPGARRWRNMTATDPAR